MPKISGRSYPYSIRLHAKYHPDLGMIELGLEAGTTSGTPKSWRQMIPGPPSPPIVEKTPGTHSLEHGKNSTTSTHNFGILSGVDKNYLHNVCLSITHGKICAQIGTRIASVPEVLCMLSAPVSHRPHTKDTKNFTEGIVIGQ